MRTSLPTITSALIALISIGCGGSSTPLGAYGYACQDGYEKTQVSVDLDSNGEISEDEKLGTIARCVVIDECPQACERLLDCGGMESLLGETMEACESSCRASLEQGSGFDAPTFDCILDSTSSCADSRACLDDFISPDRAENLNTQGSESTTDDDGGVCAKACDSMEMCGALETEGSDANSCAQLCLEQRHISDAPISMASRCIYNEATRCEDVSKCLAETAEHIALRQAARKAAQNQLVCEAICATFNDCSNDDIQNLCMDECIGRRANDETSRKDEACVLATDNSCGDVRSCIDSQDWALELGSQGNPQAYAHARRCQTACTETELCLEDSDDFDRSACVESCISAYAADNRSFAAGLQCVTQGSGQCGELLDCVESFRMESILGVEREADAEELAAEKRGELCLQSCLLMEACQTSQVLGIDSVESCSRRCAGALDSEDNDESELFSCTVYVGNSCRAMDECLASDRLRQARQGAEDTKHADE